MKVIGITEKLINKVHLIYKMQEKIEMGTISARGQICIPTNLREEMGLKEGNKILFFLTDDSLLMKKVNQKTFAEITKPLKDVMKKTKMKESDVSEMVHRFRNKK